mgnify:CR=1 FL=1
MLLFSESETFKKNIYIINVKRKDQITQHQSELYENESKRKKKQ